MSLVINATIPEGIILAADSRQSFRNRKGMARIGSDNASKIFEINSRVGVGVTGLAFLPEDGVMKNISKFIDVFKHEVKTEDMTVQEIAEKLHYLFSKKYNHEEQLKRSVEKVESDLQRQGAEIIEKKEESGFVKIRFKIHEGEKETRVGVDMIKLMVSGYNSNGNHEVYTCHIPGKVQKVRDGNEKGKEYGSSWIGQTDVVSRIVLGFDGRVGNLEFVSKAVQEKGKEEINKQLRNLEYVIQWGTMTVQDAVDFCVLMVQSTSAIQRFSDGIKGDPGDMPGVGGPVDVAVITPEKGFVWVKRKKINVEED